MKDLLVILFLLTGLFSAATEAATTEFRDLAAETHGNGHPVVMIPGLNSAASTWKETCVAIQPAECHMLHLPGFAGREPVEADRFLEYMRDQVIAYVRDRGLEKPLFVGHSLGGVLSMMDRPLDQRWVSAAASRKRRDRSVAPSGQGVAREAGTLNTG